MGSRPYSFIDIAVLDEVRRPFAEGAALAILDLALQRIVWVNGGGAALLGFPDVESALDAPAEIGPVAMRQIAALPGFPKLERPATLWVRFSRGVSSSLVVMTVSPLTLPGGENVFMLSVPVADAPSRDETEIASLIVTGLVGDGQAAAVVSDGAQVIAASEGFAELELAPETLRKLVSDVAAERDRLVKRRIAGRRGAYPAAIARLADAPARNLLIVIDELEPVEAEPEQAADAGTEADSYPEETADSTVGPQDAGDNQDAGDDVEDGVAETASTDVPAEPVAAEALEAPTPADDEASPAIETSAAGPTDEGGIADEAPFMQKDGAADTEQALSFDAGQAPSDPPASAPDADRKDADQKADPHGLPVRFVWRTDETGRFSAISEEFAQAVGAPAADVIGRTFRDVATVFGMDHTGEIAGLLERRDTWSGRSVHWPLAGTDLHVPVDLAALPVYGRERNFEGFRGFGVVRLAEARPDPERIGLSLVPGAGIEELASAAGLETAASASEETHLPVVEDDPFMGEVPVLEIGPKPAVEDGAKVVRLAERRSPGSEKQLSSVERQAFREIGERLRREQKIDHAANDAGPALSTSPEEPAASRPMRAETRGEDEHAIAFPDDPWPAFEPEGAAPVPDPVSGPVSERNLREEPQPNAARADTSILDQLPVPILLHSGDELHYANPEFLRLTGYDSLEELQQAGGLGELFVEAYDDVDTETQHEMRMRTRAGEEFPAEALLRFAPWGGRRALMLVVRQTGEAVSGAPTIEELRQRLAEMRTIIDTATDGVILVDSQGQIRSISHPAEALFGFDSDEVKGRPLISLFAVESQPAVGDYLQTLSLGGVASVLNDGREVIGREAEGRFLPMFMTIGRLPGDRGFCAVVRDITQWKRAEEELTKARADAERASAQKSDFLARVSHEIRTPLNAIIGFSELMVDEKFGPISNDRYRDYLRDINRSGSHVLDLVNDLLDLSKIEAGQQEMHYEAVSLNEALGEAVAMMQPQANRERVIIRSSFAPRLPDIVADQRSVRQIALNILSNAVRYTQAGGQVVISTAQEKNGDIVMRVRDTGVGMTQAELEQAMKPFQQVNALKRARGDGTGLGLPLTKAMVEANRARFSISSNPGEGTLVEIAFPSARILAQ